MKLEALEKRLATLRTAKSRAKTKLEKEAEKFTCKRKGKW
ncbi:unnamed protein product [Amoebophrya sp. A25]|nr:unnamed protein product [Amoebophrya sp. A25]|eukprot:GSA25T00022687001.1